MEAWAQASRLVWEIETARKRIGNKWANSEPGERKMNELNEQRKGAVNEALINDRLAKRFTMVFRENLFGGDESVSGPGSRRGSEQVMLAIDALAFVVGRFNIASVSDIPCGDFNWIEGFLTSHREVVYVGYDIVAPLIERNRARHPSHRFCRLDITSQTPPKSDLIFSKELFLHLTYDDIKHSVSNMKRSCSKYLLMSSHFGSQNIDLSLDYGGNWRPVDVCGDPIGFPQPIWRNALFGLWEMASIADPIERVGSVRPSCHEW